MKKSILEKINTKYIFKIISSYSKENYIYKLIVYSKSLQSKFDLDINKYKNRYFFSRIDEYYYDDNDLCISQKSANKESNESKNYINWKKKSGVNIIKYFF